MQIIENIEDFKSKDPLVLTIGTFDGVHRGHQAILQKVISLAKQQNSQTGVLTFSNHPSQILKSEDPIPLICSSEHKIQLIHDLKIDYLINIPFTRQLSKLSAQAFIERIRLAIPFTTLVLGFNATLGNARRGNATLIKELGKMWGFDVVYLEEYRYEGQPVSSTRIRELIAKGELDDIEKLLNRPYSIMGTIISGSGKGKVLGFPTANINIKSLCLLPFGVYYVEVKSENKCYHAIANLGIAPTIRENAQPLLEFHLLNETLNLYDQKVEVIFKKFLRSEMKFENQSLLIQQIQKDILQIRNHIS